MEVGRSCELTVSVNDTAFDCDQGKPSALQCNVLD